MLKANLKHSAGGKGEYERVFHDLFYPRSQTSRDIACGPTEDPGRNLENLWLIDERLVFHTLLASDQPLSQSGVILDDPDLTKNDEPDLIIFNPAFVASEAGGVESVAVVEFKRPGRNDYTAKSNPIAQIIEIVRKLRDGAIVIVEIADALALVGASLPSIGTRDSAERQVIADVTQRAVWDALDSPAPDLDALAARASLPARRCLAAVTALELSGAIECALTGEVRRVGGARTHTTPR